MKPFEILSKTSVAVALIGVLAGCSKNAGDQQAQSGDFNRSASAYTDTRVAPGTVVVLPNIIPSGYVMSASNTYVIDGPTYVPTGVTLTIPAGTFIKGRKTSTTLKPSFLLVTKGAKLIANGTQAEPIVFTSEEAPCSRAAGDWAGVVILGRSNTNVATNTIIEGVDATMVPASQTQITFPESFEYGGSDEADADNASSLKYVRIEFAGDELAPDRELNGLTLGAVGSASTLEHIEVSWGADDAFEFFGGSVNAKYLIAYANNDDDFDFDQGYQGAVQFAVAVKLECASGYSSNPNGIECNNITSPVVTVNSRKTHPVLSNITLLGHSATPGPQNPSGSAGIGAFFRAGTEFTFVNSIVGGFNVGVNYSAAATPSVFRDGAVHAFTTPIVATGTPFHTNMATETLGTPQGYLALDAPFAGTCDCANPGIPLFTTADPVEGGALPAVTHAGGSFPAGVLDPAGVSFQGAMGTTDWALPSFWVSYNPKGNAY